MGVGAELSFALADPGHDLAGVRLIEDVGLAAHAEFSYVEDGWRLTVAAPPIDRLEYALGVRHADGTVSTVLDPANPRTVPGAFGPKSEIRRPGYRPPLWLTASAPSGRRQTVTLDGPLPVHGELWTPDGLPDADPAPLLVVHDGPEYDRLGGFAHCLAVARSAGRVPAVRALLLGPDDRNGWYAANPVYASALGALLDGPVRTAVTTTARIGVGVSLGALALLHAHARSPFDGLVLQSGSFFTPTLDAQEREFSGFAAVTGFVTEVAAGLPLTPVPTVVTCGTVEENLANNQSLVRHLRQRGWPVEFVTVRDAHNYVAWRDALDPHLLDLIGVVSRAT